VLAVSVAASRPGCAARLRAATDGVDVVTDWLPERAVPIARIEIVEFLDDETGEPLVAERYWTVDDQPMTFVKKIGLLEQAKIAACIPMIQTAPDMAGGDDSA